MKLGPVALDGTKIHANASRHKAMSYERMQRAERELAAEVRQWQPVLSLLGRAASPRSTPDRTRSTFLPIALLGKFRHRDDAF